MTATKRVLVVDDEEDIREGVSMWLDAAGFESIQACDGCEGLDLAASERPSAIFLDMMMPNKNGIETLTDLRRSEATVDIPVVMLSASLRDEQKALDAGARFFVHKPYHGPVLIEALRAALDE
ncbi:Response regulator MprA [Pseudobythopirellula maris]|uniref:Response regulator MprA n=1 Tax=Pseudobythopirellula maris TaxID=2527991 RepID=A0A5C5ZUZ5_9BACT|nr:response regulator [Pseudobythopirellula maris]TWT90848.1 Response regulator MprA [Pseudobythopirellula maris]